MHFIIIQTAAALMYDAVYLFARSLQQLSEAHNVETGPLTCGGTNSWKQGSSLHNFIKMVTLQSTCIYNVIIIFT